MVKIKATFCPRKKNSHDFVFEFSMVAKKNV